MKNYRLIYFALPLLLLIVSSCEVTTEAPETDFTATIYDTESDYVDVTFSDLSSQSPISWEWSFEGGDPATSTIEDPTITYHEPGIYSVTLVATNSDGGEKITKQDYVNIVKFNNPTNKEIDITVNDDTQTIYIDSSVIFAAIDETSVSYYAITYGQKIDSIQHGLNLEWYNTADLTTSTSWNLNVPVHIFFLYMTNYDSEALSKIYVEYDYSNYYFESGDIEIPNDGKKYKIGYYFVEDGVDVKADRKYSSSTLFWENLDLPYTLNQSFNCDTRDLKSGKTKSTTILKQTKMAVAAPEKTRERIIDKEAKNVYAKVKK